MKYLFIKFFRDIKKLWPQFLSVFMMAMISTTIFTGMSAVWNGMTYSTERYFEQSNLADVWVYGYGITDSDMAAVLDLSYVKHAAASAYFTAGSLINGTDTEIQLVTVSEKTASVLSPLVQRGDVLETDGEGVWIDKDYADNHGLEKGSVLTLTYGRFSADVTVQGVVLDAENIFYIRSAIDSVPDHVHNGYAYIGEAYAKTLFGEIPNTQLRIALTKETNQESMEKNLREIFGERLYSIKIREEMPTIWRVMDEQQQITKMALLFSAVFILLSVLTMYTTMSRLVDNQVLQIGTMKALGFSKRQISLHYALYGFLSSVTGGLLGHIVGLSVVSPIVLKVKQSTLTLPDWSTPFSAEAALLWLFIILVCTVSALMMGRKIINGVPAQTIQGIVARKESHIKIKKRSKLPYGWLWTLRSIKLHKARFAMGVIAVSASIVLMTAGFGVQDSLKTSYNEVYDNQYTYDYAATIKTGGYQTLKELLGEESVQYAAMSNADFSNEKDRVSGVVTVLSDGEFVHLFENERALSLKESGVCMSAKLAGELGIAAGDQITLQEENSGEEKSILISHIVTAKLPQGIFVSETDWGSFSPNTLYFADNALEIVQNSNLLSGTISIESQRENTDIMINSVRSVMIILIFAAFLLSAVVLYNLGALNFMERYKEYATMKVLGFYKKELRRIVLSDTFLTLSLGLLLGIPAAFAFLKIYIGIVSMTGMEWSPYIAPWKFVFVLTVIAAFSTGIGLSISSRIRRVNMVEAMKSAE